MKVMRYLAFQYSRVLRASSLIEINQKKGRVAAILKRFLWHYDLYYNNAVHRSNYFVYWISLDIYFTQDWVSLPGVLPVASGDIIGFIPMTKKRTT
jgi:hypothetical protein